MSLEINFIDQSIHGKIDYTIQVQQNTNEVKFDSKCLQIHSVKKLNENKNEKLGFSRQIYEQHQSALGEQLLIKLDRIYKKDETFKIQIEYSTNKNESESTAMNWVTPEQTVGKKLPYAIFCRTLFPCQDSPAIKSTFNCTVQTQKEFQAWVSGVLKKNYTHQNINYFEFEQTVPIPSYLFAIVAGNVQERKISERCSVITEPEQLDKCAQELEDMEVQLTALETYTRVPYDWKLFRIVVLPNSFPYGGMENPLLTFASPTIIVGDKSQTDVVIHEMAHSWSGNYVSCSSWENFWLNEGLTMFLETKIIKILHGQNHYDMLNNLLNRELNIHIKNFGEDHEYTKLNFDLGHNNPDDAFSLIPYIKGMHFFQYIEEQIGEDQFQDLLTKYFKHYQKKSLNTQELLGFFKDFIISIKGDEFYYNLQLEKWVSTPGYSLVNIVKESQNIKEINEVAQNFITQPTQFLENQTTKTQFNNFCPELKVIFLQNLYDNLDKISTENLLLLDQLLEITDKCHHAEINTKWILILINKDIYTTNDKYMQKIESHLQNIGRMKYLRPVYKEFAKNEKNIEIGRQIFKKNQDFYHSIASKMIRFDLGIKNA